MRDHVPGDLGGVLGDAGKIGKSLGGVLHKRSGSGARAGSDGSGSGTAGSGAAAATNDLLGYLFNN